MSDGVALEKILTAEMLELIDGRTPERTEKLKAEFRVMGLVVIPDCFSQAGLQDMRKYLDVLGTDVEMPNPLKSLQHKVEEGYTRHIRENAFVRALQDEGRFVGFLSRFTPHPRITAWKASVAIRFKKDGPTPPWHFDGPSVSVVIPIDAPMPGSGGGFAYFPVLRRHGEAAWLRTLKRVITRMGVHWLYRRPVVVPYTAGSMIIFDGNTTYHRAMPLKRQALRRSLLVTFATGQHSNAGDKMM